MSEQVEVATRKVMIPARPTHHGIFSLLVEVEWICPKCGGPRGDVFPALSYDGSRRLSVDGWRNPCGHVDKYSAVLKEARKNGLNAPRS